MGTRERASAGKVSRAGGGGGTRSIIAVIGPRSRARPGAPEIMAITGFARGAPSPAICVEIDSTRKTRCAGGVFWRSRDKRDTEPLPTPGNRGEVLIFKAGGVPLVVLRRT